MKINKSTRIRVDRDINKELGLTWWDSWTLKIKIKEEYGMILTSKRNNSYYFKLTNAQNYMLFVLNYGRYILKKKQNNIKRYQIL